MNWIASKALASGRAAAVVALTGVLLTTAGGRTGIASGSREGLEGVWTVEVTPRDCVTNAAAGAPFNSLVSFHDGGTLSESAGGRAFAAGQRSAGHGTWTREGRRTFMQRMIALVVFDTPANLPGNSGVQPELACFAGLPRGLANRHSHDHTQRCGPSDLVRDQRVLQVGWHVVQDRLFDGDRPAIRIVRAAWQQHLSLLPRCLDRSGRLVVVVLELRNSSGKPGPTGVANQQHRTRAVGYLRN